MNKKYEPLLLTPSSFKRLWRSMLLCLGIVLGTGGGWHAVGEKMLADKINSQIDSALVPIRIAINKTYLKSYENNLISRRNLTKKEKKIVDDEMDRMESLLEIRNILRGK